MVITATPPVSSTSIDTGVASVARGGAEQVAGDDHPVDLGRSLADPFDPQLAIPALKRQLLRDPHPTEHLDAPIDDPPGRLGRVHLADRRVHLEILTQI